MTEAQGYFLIYAVLIIAATMNREIMPLYCILSFVSGIAFMLGIIKLF